MHSQHVSSALSMPLDPLALLGSSDLVSDIGGLDNPMAQRTFTPTGVCSWLVQEAL